MDSLGLSTYVFCCSMSCSITPDVALGVKPAALRGPRCSQCQGSPASAGRATSALPGAGGPRVETTSHHGALSRHWGCPVLRGGLNRRQSPGLNVHPLGRAAWAHLSPSSCLGIASRPGKDALLGLLEAAGPSSVRASSPSLSPRGGPCRS